MNNIATNKDANSNIFIQLDRCKEPRKLTNPKSKSAQKKIYEKAKYGNKFPTSMPLNKLSRGYNTHPGA